MQEHDVERAVQDQSIYNWSEDQLREAARIVAASAGRGPRAKQLTDYVPLISYLLDQHVRNHAESIAGNRHAQMLRWTKIAAIAALAAALLGTIALCHW